MIRLNHHTRMRREAGMVGHSAAGVGLILPRRQGLQREDLAPLLATGGNAIGHLCALQLSQHIALFLFQSQPSILASRSNMPRFCRQRAMQ